MSDISISLSPFKCRKLDFRDKKEFQIYLLVLDGNGKKNIHQNRFDIMHLNPKNFKLGALIQPIEISPSQL